MTPSTAAGATPSGATFSPRSGPLVKSETVIAVASGKGGVGKTWFSITLAHALALRAQKTLLFDGDLGLANVDIQLGLTPKYDLGAVITGKAAMHQAATRYEAGGFDVLAGRSGSGSLASAPLSRLQMMADDLSLLAPSYNKVLIDLGAGVEKNIRLLCKAAGRILVVTFDEPTSLTDAYAFIKITAMERPDADIRLVVNAANSPREGERTYNTLRKACENFLKITLPLAGIVRRDMRVRDAIRNQSSILIRSPNSDAARDVEAIADRLLKT